MSKHILTMTGQNGLVHLMTQARGLFFIMGQQDKDSRVFYKKDSFVVVIEIFMLMQLAPLLVKRSCLATYIFMIMLKQLLNTAMFLSMKSDILSCCNAESIRRWLEVYKLAKILKSI